MNRAMCTAFLLQVFGCNINVEASSSTQHPMRMVGLYPFLLVKKRKKTKKGKWVH